MIFFIRLSVGAVIYALLTCFTAPASAGPSATMRFMEHLHAGGSANNRDGGEAKLYVSKRAWVEDRACRRLAPTPHLTLQRPWFPTAAEMAEGFWSADVAALAC